MSPFSSDFSDVSPLITSRSPSTEMSTSFLLNPGISIVNMNASSVSEMFVFGSSSAVYDSAAGTAPILTDDAKVYSNPLPSVLILTAIVVGIATTAVALGLVVRIHESYGSIEEDEIGDMDEEP